MRKLKVRAGYLLCLLLFPLIALWAAGETVWRSGYFGDARDFIIDCANAVRTGRSPR